MNKHLSYNVYYNSDCKKTFSISMNFDIDLFNSYYYVIIIISLYFRIYVLLYVHYSQINGSNTKLIII